MSDVIISVENLGKKYVLSHQGGGEASKALRVIARRRRGMRIKMEEDIGYGISDMGKFL